jgi:hypothetical protein
MKKIHEWVLWDWKSIILTPLLIATLFFFFYSLDTLIPDKIRSHRSKTYSCTTQADFIKWHRRTYQSRSSISTSAFEITYSYVVNNQKFLEMDVIPNTLSYQKFLGGLQYDGVTTFPIKYDPASPSNSQIITDNPLTK